MELKGSLTEGNLLKAFAGESQARNRYNLFAEKAKADGYQQIAEVFNETASQEYQHAKRFFSYLQGGMLSITAEYPAGKVGTTSENLLEAAEGEKMEWSMLYNNFGDVAKDEGFKDIASAFHAISEVEKFHEWRYRTLLERVVTKTEFKRDEPIKWQCISCGYIFEGKTPPAKCPACLNPREFFEPLATNY
jgi:hypothetical protein